jgi:outer membrane protein assembly factor BamB
MGDTMTSSRLPNQTLNPFAAQSAGRPRFKRRSHRPSTLGRLLGCVAIASAVFASCINDAYSADWPTWRIDAGRHAATPEQLPADLNLQWSQILPKLKPAWPEDSRLHFDASYEPVISGETLFFGSSNNDSVTAVDLKSGQAIWQHFAEGPVRFAPLVHAGRVYFGADDGCLYCVDAKTGRLQWRFQAAPNRRKVIGSERMISVWPVRGGPVLVDGRIHFTAGVWPFEGAFLYSIDADTGELVKKEQAAIEHDVITLDNMTPQGYLASTKESLFIPQGRSGVAVLNHKTQKFSKFSYRTSAVTTYHVSATDRWLFHGAVTFDMPSKKQISSSTRAPVIGDGVMYATEAKSVNAYDLTAVKMLEKTDRRGKKTKVPVLNKLWSVPTSVLHAGLSDAAKKEVASHLPVVDLLAGNQIYGHQGGLAFALSATEKQPSVTWTAMLKGEVASMIAANGRLVVVAQDGQKGSLHCFAAAKTNPKVHKSIEPKLPAQDKNWTDRVARILEADNPGDAYCVVLGIGSGGLVSELIRQSKLRIILIDQNASAIGTVKRQYEQMGLYGSRLVAHAGDLESLQLPPYLANLIVSEMPKGFGLATNEQSFVSVFQALRPYGGTAWLAANGSTQDAIAKNVTTTKLAQAEAVKGNDFIRIVRKGALPGSADWTHEYGDASNTLMSHDKLVKAPLGVLWFGGPAADGSLFYNRHFWGPSMAVIGGRMFLQGPGKMTAVDVYTGRILWQMPLAGTANYLPGRRGNDFERSLAGYHFLAVEDAVYLVHQKILKKIDPSTGDVINEFKLPNPEDDWGRIRVVKDKLIAEVFRKLDADKKKLPPSRQLLAGTQAAVEIRAIDRNSGSELWTFEAEASFPVLAVGTDRLFAFDGAFESFYKDWKRRGKIPKASDIRSIKAIDLETGKLIWKKDSSLIGTWLSYSGEQEVVLMSNKSNIMALDGRDGNELWKKKSDGVGFRGHPESLWDRLIVWNDRILDQRGPGLAWDLKTGERMSRIHPITKEETPWEFTKSGHHCNYAIASPHLMTFRAASAGFCDIETGNTSRLEGFRSGCRNSLIPANGVLNAPNMAHGCICGYSLFTSLALVHLPDTEVWSYSALKVDSKKDAVRQVGINFGAPGDRQDKSGTLWLDYPNVGGSSPAVPIKVTADSPRYFRRHSSLLSGTGVKWIAGSGIEGVSKVSLTMRQKVAGKSERYSVRLHFSEPDQKKVGERVFDIKVQGKTVVQGFDIASASAGQRAALQHEFETISNDGTVSVELVSKVGRAVLSGIEVIAVEQ